MLPASGMIVFCTAWAKHLLAGLALLLALSPRLQAGVTEAEAALLSGSPRLALRVLEGAGGAASRRVSDQLRRELGFAHSGPGLQLLRREGGLRPVLRYDDNINNGIPGRELILAGLPFVVDAGSRARAGLLLGAQVNGAALWSWAPGGTLSFAAGAGAEHAIRHDLSVRTAWGSACLSQRSATWTWVGLCQALTRERRELGRSDSPSTSVSLTQVFRTNTGAQEATAHLGRSERGRAARSFASLSWKLARAGLGAVDLALYTEQRRPGVSTVNYRLSAGLRSLWRKKVITFGLWYGEEGGGQLFGTRRADRIAGLRISATVTARVQLNIGYRQRLSSHAVFNTRGLYAGFDVTALRF